MQAALTGSCVGCDIQSSPAASMIQQVQGRGRAEGRRAIRTLYEPVQQSSIPHRSTGNRQCGRAARWSSTPPLVLREHSTGRLGAFVSSMNRRHSGSAPGAIKVQSRWRDAAQKQDTEQHLGCRIRRRSDKHNKNYTSPTHSSSEASAMRCRAYHGARDPGTALP